MNVPLVTNTLTSHFRSVSPPATRQRFPQQKSPSHHTLIPSHTNISKNQITDTSTQNQSKPISQPDPDAFKVYVRIRPLNNREALGNNSRKGLSIVKKQDNMIFVFDPELAESSRKEKAYVFDNVFEETSCTADIYNEALTPAFQNMIQGFNSTIFAYGMTGAGKTFTMFGDIYSSEGGIYDHPGFINLMVRDIFQVFAAEGEKGFEFSMKLSYIEIYNEHIRDLLNPSTENLMVVEDPLKGVLIPNLSEFVIESEEELLKFIITGNSRRVMASTHANQFSSRSHAIIQLVVEKRNRVRDIHETYYQSKLCFVDLAGSERAATTENRGIRMTEGANINRSLLALGNCINILSDSNKRGAFVPYRDSKLTRLLKDSLGGNTRTIMVACVSPATIAYEETVNTLNYASRARKIKKKVVSNVKEVELHVSQYKEIIETLKTEIDSLKSKLQERNEGGRPSISLNEMSQSQEIDKEMHVGSLDRIGNSLFENLEENWEIRQNLKDLIELKTQNELSLAIKKEELEKASTNMALAESLLKEITSLQEVMAYNETVEKEMQASLEENLKEKKRIQDRILAMGSHWTGSNSYEGLERSLQTLSGNREIQKEFLDLHKEKIEKDTRIQQLEKEINEMKKQLVEKDKLLAQNDRTSKLASHPLSVTKAGKASSYTTRAMPSNLGSDNYLSGGKDIKPRKIESQGHIPEEIRQNKEIATSKKGEVIVRRGPELSTKGISEQNFPQTSTSSKKSGKFFKGSGLNENTTKTAANTIRQMVKNKYKNAIQPVSVEELKNYAEKLKGMNFENAPIASQKQVSRQQNLTVAPNSQMPITRTSQRVVTEVPKNSRNNMNKNVRHGYFNKHQRSVGGNMVLNQRNQGHRSSRDGTPEKELSELSSIMMQQNEHSLDHSVDDYILNSAEKKNRNLLPEPKERKSHSGKQDLRQASSPNFHLNIMCLMKDNNTSANKQNVQVSSLNQIYDGDQYETKEPRSVPYLIDRGADSSRKENVRTSETGFVKPLARPPINDLKIKASNSQIQPIQEETPSEGTKGLATKNKNFDKFIRSENLDYETFGGRHLPIKHMRSTSLHPEDMSGVQKSLCSLEESSSLQKIPEADVPKRSTNDIRSLEAARDIVRSFRSRLTYLSSLAEKNMLEEQHAQEVGNLMREYNENKDLLSNKDLATLETVALFLSGSKGTNLYLKSQSDEVQEHKGHRSSSANVTVPKNIPLSIKDLAIKNNESYRVYKKSTDFTATNESLSSGRGSVPDERPSTNVKSMTKVDPISIYNQFSVQEMQARKEPTTSPRNQMEEYQSFRKSIEGGKGKTSIEVQNLIDKQKKNMEEFDRAKKDIEFSQQKKE